MSGLVNKVKSKLSGSGSGHDNERPNQEQSFSIQPHPARSNNPADLEPPQPGGGLNSNPEWQAHQAKGPFQPAPEQLANFPEPKSREELQARSTELNQ